MPVAAPRRSGMLSDGEPIGVPAARLACPHCGVAWLPQRFANGLRGRPFGSRYALNTSRPTDDDRARHGAYAARIVQLWRRSPPASVLDVGCGNGMLLSALRSVWREARVAGVEPAPQPAAVARAAGLSVDATLRPGSHAELVVSVNVIEHVADPLGFLVRLRRAVLPGGVVLIMCPDGETPWFELLMSDHRWSFTRAALISLAVQAGFSVIAIDKAKGAIQAIALAPALSRRCKAANGGYSALARERRAYLARWRRLDETLLSRLTGRRLIGFGVGEAARLLRAYAPGTWRHVAAVTADDAQHAAEGGQRLGKPSVRLGELHGADDELLLAVRPAAQARLVERFVARGLGVLRWDDVVMA